MNNTRARQCPRCKGPTRYAAFVQMFEQPKLFITYRMRDFCERCRLYWVFP